MAEEPGFMSSTTVPILSFTHSSNIPDSRSCPTLVWETQSGVRLTATLREMERHTDTDSASLEWAML